MEAISCKIMLPSIIFIVILAFVDKSHGIPSKEMINFGNLAETLGDLLGDSDDCKYKCSNGATPQPKPNFQKKANGCGSYGLTFNMASMPGMTECCNVHDFCYDTCNNDRAQCDRQLKACMDNICRELKRKHRRGKRGLSDSPDCETLSQMLYGGASTLGCKAYQDAQAQACVCTHPTSHGHHGNTGHHGNYGHHGNKRTRERWLHNDL